MDFIGNLLNQMSSAFNQETAIPKKEEISMDETLKWRALKNNQFASRTRQPSSSGGTGGGSGSGKGGRKVEANGQPRPGSSATSSGLATMMTMSSAENSNDSGPAASALAISEGRRSAPILDGSLDDTNSSALLSNGGASSTPDLMIAGIEEDDDLEDGIEIEIAKDISGEELQEALGLSQLVVETIDDLSQQSQSSNSVPPGSHSKTTPIMKSEDEKDEDPIVRRDAAIGSSLAAEESSIADDLHLPATKTEKPEVVATTNATEEQEEREKERKEVVPGSVSSQQVDASPVAVIADADAADDDVVIIAPSTVQEVVVLVAEDGTKEEEEEEQERGACASAASESAAATHMTTVASSAASTKCTEKKQAVLTDADPVAATSVASVDEVERKYRPQENDSVRANATMAETAGGPSVDDLKLEESLEKKTDPDGAGDGEEKLAEAARPPSAGRATRSKKTSISSATTVTPPPLAGVANAANSSSQRRSQRFVKDSGVAASGKLNGEQQSRSSPVVVKEEQEEPAIKKKTNDESSKQANVSMATTTKVAAIDRSSSSSTATLKSDRSLRSKQLQSSQGVGGPAASAIAGGRRASETVKSACQEDSNDSIPVAESEPAEKPPNRRGRKRLSHQEQTAIATPQSVVVHEEPTVASEESQQRASGSGTRSVFPLDPGENDSGGKQQQQQQQQQAPVAVPAPNRRGRKRKNPIPVDATVNTGPVTAASAAAASSTSSLPYGKRMLRMSRDGSEGILASALARRDKVDSQGRSSRPIKLSAKMLANEELRQGFEQHNNGRIIIASDSVNTDDTTTDRDRERASETSSRKQSATVAAAAAATAAAAAASAAVKAGSIGAQQRAERAGSGSSLSSSSEDVTLVSVTKVVPTVAPVATSVKRGSAEAKETKRIQDSATLPVSTEATVKGTSNEGIRTTIQPQQQQAPTARCPDLQTFLQEIRSMRLGTNRSPEENPKLNRRQIKRLGKLKEKHLLALGLRRKSKENQRNGVSTSAADQSDGASVIPSDTESSGSEAEFVPSGKIGTVGKPSVTLRLRKPETLLENPRSLAGGRPASLPSGPSTGPARSGGTKAKQQQQQQQTNGRNIANAPGSSSRRQSAIVLPAAATTLPGPFSAPPPSKDMETEHLQRSLKRLGCEVTIIPQAPRPQAPISSSSAPRATSVARSGAGVGAGSSQRKQQRHNKTPKGISQAAQALRTLSSVSPSLEIVLDKRPIGLATAPFGNKRTPFEASGSTKTVVEASGTTGGTVDGGLVCLCAQISDVYVRRPAGNGYCTAIDDIDGQPIGCCNELTEDEVIMLRPSASVSFQVFCNMHRKRLEDHGCCAVCGHFCTQGNFAMCKNVHLFHPNCAKKYILNTPYNSNRPDEPPTAPILVLQCPHCARECPNGEIQVNIQLTTPPVLLPSRSNVVKPAKMTVSKPDSSSTNGGTVGEDIFRTKVNALVPSSVKNMLATSSSGGGGINGNGSGSLAAAPRAGSSSGRSERSNNGTGVGGSRRKTTFTKQDFYRAITTQHNDVDRVSEIIASGFDIETRFADIHGGTCLHLVAHYGTITSAYLIISRARSVDYLNIADNVLRTAMMCALEQKKFEIIKLLLDCGADATVKGPDGMTVLHIAARHGHHEAVRTILESVRKRLTARELSSFLNRGDGGRWTALAWAAENRHKETIQQLLELGADVNVCDLENNTSLHWATLAGCTDTLYLLLNKCCDTNVQNTSGDTPLHIACRLGHASSCILLMAKGASLTIRNNAGEQPMDAIGDPDSECASILGANLKMRLLAKNTKETRVLSSDISNGRERYPVQVVQTVGANDRLQALPKFKYVKRTVQVECSVQMDTNLRNMRLCSCTDDCSSEGANCVCSERGWYNADGRLVDDFNYHHPPEIVECGDACDCNRLVCRNRVVQRGLLVPLQIFHSAGKGWSVRTLVRIAKGSFLVEYVGELLTDEAADRRPDDSYIFDLGAGYCMDASAYGNVSRFFNHSCKPNVSPVRVFYEHQDTRFPKVAMFACRDIEPQEEICFDYGDKFWMVKNRTVCCQCNASECRYRTVQQAGDGCPVTVVL
ncbi:hypothetical protein AND_009901 [Anopheles darlingi]|uniref:Histone-lysine N-methyltransferase EHMT2 n=1 Tax=Anopheles darlingi TaxID=43151 RepID=W5J3S8_ANODA|nr:hypothetical protein AND_009901 [Anopheles darlingi]